jgi:hypothetical protein
MKLELRRVEPLRAANIGGLVYGIGMAVFAVVFLPFLFLGALVGRARGAVLLMPFLLLLYPLIGATMGWLTFLIGASIYNFVIRWTGGMLIEFAEERAPGDSL